MFNCDRTTGEGQLKTDTMRSDQTAVALFVFQKSSIFTVTLQKLYTGRFEKSHHKNTITKDNARKILRIGIGPPSASASCNVNYFLEAICKMHGYIA